MQAPSGWNSIMQRTMTVILVSTVFFAAALFVGCGDGERQQRAAGDASDSSTASNAVDFSGRVPVDSLRVDCTGDGTHELVVASRPDSLEEDPLLRGSFDRVDILSADSTASRLFVDPVDYGRSMEAREITGDGVSDVIVHLDAGGNNPITSRGMHVYGLNDRDQVTLLFYTASGRPRLRDLDGDGDSEILLSDQFWGMVPHSEALGFTSQIYTYDNGMYVPARDRFEAYFAPILNAKRTAYEQLRRAPVDGEEARSQLYLRMADYLAWSYARGGVNAAASLWRSERGFLRSALSAEQFEDLRTFVNDVQQMEREQSGGLS